MNACNVHMYPGSVGLENTMNEEYEPPQRPQPFPLYQSPPPPPGKLTRGTYASRTDIRQSGDKEVKQMQGTPVGQI